MIFITPFLKTKAKRKDVFFMKKVCTKCIVAALLLSFGISAGLPAAAAEVQPAQIVVAAEAVQNTTQEKAKQYFANYPSDKHVVSVERFLEVLGSEEKNCVIDLRSEEDYAKGHIEGAVNIPYGTAVADALEQIPNDVPVYVYCYSGQTASQTVALLNLAGKNAYNVSGGFDNGISKAENAAELFTKKESVLEEGSYPVEKELQQEIREYYQTATENDKFNMSAEKVKEALQNDEIYLVDIRSENDYLKSHIAGAKQNIPFGKGMEKQLAKLPKDKKIVFQCYSGQTASQTVAIARMMGLDAYNLSGGMGAEGGSGWLGAGYGVVKATTQQFLNAKVDRYFAALPENKNQVSAADFLKATEQAEEGKMMILDIRSAEDYEKGHVKGAINLPYGVDVAKALEKIPTDIPVYVYCYSGQTASQTMFLLRLAGKQAVNVSGGFDKGISKEENAEEYLTTEAAEFGKETYAVDEDIKAAIEQYYKNVAKETEYAKNNMSPKALKELTEQGSEEIYVVDLRSAEDYAEGHIEGAVNLPYGKGMQKEFDKLPTDKTLVLQCYSGQTASQTMAALRIKGYNVYNLSGGMGAEGGSGWLGAGYTLVK